MLDRDLGDKTFAVDWGELQKKKLYTQAIADKFLQG